MNGLHRQGQSQDNARGGHLLSAGQGRREGIHHTPASILCVFWYTPMTICPPLSVSPRHHSSPCAWMLIDLEVQSTMISTALCSPRYNYEVSLLEPQESAMTMLISCLTGSLQRRYMLAVHIQ